MKKSPIKAIRIPSYPALYPRLALLGMFALPVFAGPHVLELKYEWSQNLAGPWAPVPAESIDALGDGSVRVHSEEDQNFFRLNINEAGQGGTLPVRPLSGLSAAVTEKADRLFLAVRGTEGETADEWEGARFGPFVCPIYSPWNQSGTPDFIEFKLRVDQPPAPAAGPFGGWGQPHECDRGYFVMSLTSDEPPVPAFASSGRTMAEQLLERCGGKAVARIVQFGPTFVAGEDANGDLVGFLGHAPSVFPESDYAKIPLGLSRSGGSEVTPPPTLVPIDYSGPLTFASYAQFKAAFTGSGFLRRRHDQRATLTAFDHLALEGRAPTLTLADEETESFLLLERFTGFFIDQEDERFPVATIDFRRTGVTITGHTVGSWRLTLTKSNGERVRYLLNITPKLLAAASCVSATHSWYAGGWADQPRYRQLERSRWCPKVGCGPVSLQILFSWWERVRGVPSAFFRRQHNPQSSELLQSLRSVDAPFESSTNDVNIIHWYDYWHEACDVWCPTSEGATMPNELGEAYESFLNYISSSTFALFNTGNGNPLVGCDWHWEADIISDDWDESGVRLAEEIKDGRPGIALYMEMPHYMVAYGYRRMRTECDGFPAPWQRFFKCNMGWGSSVEWKNAYDIDGCWLLELWQKRIP